MSDVVITEVNYDKTESQRRGFWVNRQNSKMGRLLKEEETVALKFDPTT